MRALDVPRQRREPTAAPSRHMNAGRRPHGHDDTPDRSIATQSRTRCLPTSDPHATALPYRHGADRTAHRHPARRRERRGAHASPRSDDDPPPPSPALDVTPGVPHPCSRSLGVRERGGRRWWWRRRRCRLLNRPWKCALCESVIDVRRACGSLRRPATERTSVDK